MAERGPVRRRHVLFDLDGTLTDPKEGITRCYRHALRRLGEPLPEADGLERFIGPPLRDGFRELLGSSSRERLDTAVRFYRERFTAVGLFENRLYGGIRKCLGELLGAGRALYVATSKPTGLAVRILEHFSLLEYFRAVYGAELDGSISAKGEVIHHLVSSEAVPPADAVMVGDRRHDIDGARQNGMAAVAVAWGYGSQEELAAARPEAIVKTPAALVEHLLA